MTDEEIIEALRQMHGQFVLSTKRLAPGAPRDALEQLLDRHSGMAARAFRAEGPETTRLAEARRWRAALLGINRPSGLADDEWAIVRRTLESTLIGYRKSGL